jgi:hypothetical protein
MSHSRTYPVLFSGAAVEWNAAKRQIVNILHSENAMEGITGSPPVFFATLTPPRAPTNPARETVSFGSPTKLSEIGMETRAKSKQVKTTEPEDAMRQYEADLAAYEAKLIELDKLQADRDRRTQAFNQVKANAFKILLETTSKSVQAEIKTEFDTHDPKIIWKALEDKYGVSPVSKLARVYGNLIGIVLQNDETVGQYCVRLEDIFSTLESRGETVTDTFRLAFLVNGIERSKRAPDYQLVLAIQENLNANYSDTRQALIEEEITKGKNQKGESKGLVVHEISTNHRDGRRQKSSRRDNDNKSNDRVCEWCKKRGHLINDCFALQKHMEERDKSTPTTNKPQNKPDDKRKTVNSVVIGSVETNEETTKFLGLDTCASQHITGDKTLLKSLTCGEEVEVRAYNGTKNKTHSYGEMGNFGKSLYVETSKSNLLSFNQLLDEGMDIYWNQPTRTFTVSKNSEVLGSFSPGPNNTFVARISEAEITTKEDKERAEETQKLHERLAHPSEEVLKNMLNSGNILNTHLTAKDVDKYRSIVGTCKGCAIGKMTRQSQPESLTPVAENIGDLLHMDIVFFAGQTYLLSSDDHSNHILSIKMENKEVDTVVEAIHLICDIYTQHGFTVKEIRTDAEAVFIAATGDIHRMGVKHSTTAPDHHEVNIERMVRTIKEKTRALIHNLPYQLPKMLYCHAWQYSIISHNKVSNSKTGNSTPNILVKGVKLDVKLDCRASFGDIGYFYKPKGSSNKDGVRAELGIVLGRVPTSNGTLRVFIPATKQIVSRFKFKSAPVTEEFKQYMENRFDDEDVTDEDTGSEVDEVNEDIEVNMVTDTPENVMKDTAIKAELKQLLDMKVFEGVHIGNLSTLERKRIIPSKMILKMKFKPDGSPDKFKGRLAAGGHREIIDPSEELYSPTVDISSFFTIIGIASKRKMKIQSSDVKGAYLETVYKGRPIHMRFNKEMTKIIIVIAPELTQFVVDGCLIVKLCKAIYGLKESAKLWYLNLCDKLQGCGFNKSKKDPCVFHKIGKSGGLIICCVHVDDMFFAADDLEDLKEVNKYLNEVFTEVTVQTGDKVSYLGMSLCMQQETGRVTISQHGYIQDVLDRYNVKGQSKTPSDNNLFAKESDEEICDQELFTSKVMSLLYLAKRTRPDILKEVSICTTRAKSPSVSDMKRIDRVLKYLNGTKFKELEFLVNELEVYSYVDASYAIHPDGKSHTGAIISLGKNGGTIWAKSSKQKIVTLSSTEAELVAVHESMQRAIWIRDLIMEFGIKCGPIHLMQDNESTIHLIKNGAIQYKSKHINVRYFSIKEKIDEEIVTVSHLPTDQMKADILTKPLFGSKFIQMQQWILNEFSN